MHPDHTPFPGLPDPSPYPCDLPSPQKKEEEETNGKSNFFVDHILTG